MFQELEGRHALITGAGAGIGAAIALQLAQAGCRLTLCGRSQGTLQAQAETLRAQVTSPNGTTMQATARFDEADLEKVFIEATEAALARAIELGKNKS